MNILKKSIGALCALVMAVLLLNIPHTTAAADTQDAEFTKTAIEIAKDMGNGWNLGNTMESTCNWINNPGVTDFETAWGNPVTTKAMIDGIKARGFDSIRIPIAWSNMISNDGKYTINQAYFDRIDEIIGYAFDNDMYVMINIHWDGGWWDGFLSSDTSVYNDTMKHYTSLWTQIANHYKNYSEKLIFESANEELGVPYYTSDAKDGNYDTVNTINQKFVDIVRASGGNNAKRYLLIAGYTTDIEHTCNSNYKMPTDTIKNHMLVSVHYYNPSTFCIANNKDNSWGYMDSWGTDSDKATMKEYFEKLKKFTNEGYGVVIGEYGVTFREDGSLKTGTMDFLNSVVSMSREYGYAAYLWDAGNWYDRKNLSFKYSEMNAIYMKTAAGSCGTKAKWQLDMASGVLTISGSGAMSNYNSAKSTPWYAYKDCIKTVSVGSGITSVGNYSFCNLKSLKKVTGMTNVVTIGGAAFSNDTALISVAGCEKVTTVNGYSFNNCTALTTVGKTANQIRLVSAVKINDHAFYGCKENYVYVSSKLTTIGKYAFYSNKSLTGVYGTSKVTAIGEYAFRYCSVLSKIEGCTKVTSIGKYAFCNCTKLAQIGDTLTIARLSGIVNIGDYAFYGCNGIKTVYTNNTVLNQIGNSAFKNCTSLSYVALGAHCTKVLNNAFQGCSALTKVTGMNKVSTIGSYAFYGCTKLSRVGNENYYVKLSSAVTIGDYAFYSCKGFKTLYTNNGYLNKVGKNAFRNCTSLSYAALGSHCTIVDSQAFYGCSALTKVTGMSKVSTIGSYAFYGCTKLSRVGNENYYVKLSSAVTIGDYAFYGCKGFKTLYTNNGYLNKVGKNAFRNCTSLSYAALGAHCTTIDSQAFYGCTALKKVAGMAKVTSIGSYAFAKCTSLTTFVSGSKLKSIGSYAFYGDGKLASIKLQTTVLTSVGTKAFSGIKSTAKIYVPKSKLSSYKKGVLKGKGQASTVTIINY